MQSRTSARRSDDDEEGAGGTADRPTAAATRLPTARSMVLSACLCCAVLCRVCGLISVYE